MEDCQVFLREPIEFSRILFSLAKYEDQIHYLVTVTSCMQPTSYTHLFTTFVTLSDPGGLLTLHLVVEP